MSGRDFWPSVVGGALGLAIAGYAMIYAPMKRNHDQCGKMTLCPAAENERLNTEQAG